MPREDSKQTFLLDYDSNSSRQPARSHTMPIKKAPGVNLAVPHDEEERPRSMSRARTLTNDLARRLTRVSTVIHHTLYEGTPGGTLINAMACIIGGGILALPLALANASMIPGIIVLLLFGFLAMGSLVVMVYLCERMQLFSFRELMDASFPTDSSFAGRFGESVVLCQAFGTLSLYGRVIGDSMPPVFDQIIGKKGIWSHNYSWILASSVIFVITSCARKMNELRFISAVGIASIVWVVFTIIGRYGVLPENGTTTPEVEWFSVNTTILQSVAAICLCYMYHFQIPALYVELADRTPRKMINICASSYAIVISLYLAAGFYGIMTFGVDEIKNPNAGGNILNNYPPNDTAVNIGRVLMFFHFVCVYPIFAVAARNSLHRIVFNTENEPKRVVIFIEAVFLVAATVCIAIFVDGISVIIDIAGALFYTATGFVFPGLMAYKLSKFFPTKEQIVLAEKGEANAHDSPSVSISKGMEITSSRTVDTVASSATHSVPMGDGQYSLHDVGGVSAELMRRVGYFYTIFGVLVMIGATAITVKNDIA